MSSENLEKIVAGIYFVSVMFEDQRNGGEPRFLCVLVFFHHLPSLGTGLEALQDRLLINR